MLKPHSDVPIMDEMVSIVCESVRQVFRGEKHISMLAVKSLLDDTSVPEDAAEDNILDVVVHAELKKPILVVTLLPPIHKVKSTRGQFRDEAGPLPMISNGSKEPIPSFVQIDDALTGHGHGCF